MALTRKMLKAMGIEDEKIDEIITAHTETVDALKEERDTYKADADKLPNVQKELNTLKDAQENGNKDEFKDKLTALQKEYDDYKESVKTKETETEKREAYKNLLGTVGVSSKRINAILKVTDLSKIELTKDGKIKDTDKIEDGIKTDWADFIVSETKTGADIKTPPSNETHKTYSRDEINGMSESEINKNWDAIKSSLNDKGEK